MSEPSSDFVLVANHVRDAVRCVLHCSGRYLFIDLRGDADPFVIPAGGGMEYGEHSRDTAIREISEELGVEVEPRFLGVIENRFTHRGKQGHGIEFLYIATVDQAVKYAVGDVATESNGTTFSLAWFTLAELDGLDAKIAPVGLLEMLRG